ncbi:hypothetical protein ACFFGT_09770 [Mucilaginibacter angelicae]|uniref:Uncharacterized protein n=1 Tax=Mucilaginibacter angelicae TaxID=869718 RepID=A0ABV6L4T2_9SPHI
MELIGAGTCRIQISITWKCKIICDSTEVIENLFIEDFVQPANDFLGLYRQHLVRAPIDPALSKLISATAL